jgi:hypothetical protein
MLLSPHPGKNVDAKMLAEARQAKRAVPAENVVRIRFLSPTK